MPAMFAEMRPKPTHRIPWSYYRIVPFSCRPPALAGQKEPWPNGTILAPTVKRGWEVTLCQEGVNGASIFARNKAF